MNIHIDEEIQNLIEYVKKYTSRNVPSPPNSNIHQTGITNPEFEIRISINKKGLPKQLFLSLNNLCKKTFGSSSIQYSKVSIYKKETNRLATYLRQIENFDNEQSTDPITTQCQIKTKDREFDREYKSLLDKNLITIRYSFSNEIDINCPIIDPEAHLIDIRERRRIEYDTKKGYMYVFTSVKNSKSAESTFELEIEFDYSILSVSIVNESLSFFAPYLFTSNIPVSYLKKYQMDPSEKNKENSNLSTETIMKHINEFILVGKKQQRDQQRDQQREQQREQFDIPKPQNIKDTDEVYDILKKGKYQVTNKLDGERCLLLFYDTNIFSIRNIYAENPIILLLDIVSKDKTTSIVDVELFKDKFYFFDCYVYNNTSVYNQTLSKRLEYAKILADINPSLCLMKDFSSNLLETTEQLLATLDRSKNDGLIFTPYLFDKHFPIYKWKFQEKMSIDFRVVLVSQSQTPLQYIYNLCVYTKNNDAGTVPFRYEIDKKQYTAKYVSNSPLTNNGIYEFTYDNKFILLRYRHDKDKPNFINTAIDVWKDIVRPLEAYKLLNLFRPLRIYRRCHNSIKEELIKEYCKNKSILDLGIGAGGDFWKYEKCNVKKIYGVEPYEKNYTDFKKRLLKLPTTFQEKVNLIETVAQNTQKIVETVGISGVDIVTSFFSLSFFFFQDKPQDLDQLVQTISQNLKEGGYFIGTTIEGKQTQKILYDLTDYKLNFPGGFIQLDPKTNNIILDIQGTIVERQVESLVDFDKLIDKLAYAGIFLEKSVSFSPCSDMIDDNERKLNSMYITFVFRKDNISESINKLCNKNNIYDLVTRSNDEHCISIFQKIISNMSNIDIEKFPPEEAYNALLYFYNVKKYINPLNSMNLPKVYALFGDRLHKTLVSEKIPSNAVALRNYKNKDDFLALKDQLSTTMELLRLHHINYGNLTLDGLLVIPKDQTGLVKLLFHNYENIQYKPEEYSDNKNYIKLLEYLNE